MPNPPVPLPQLTLARTDADFRAIARAIRDYGTEDLERFRSIKQLIDARAKTAAIADYLKRAMTDRSLQLEAQNDLAELRLRQERRIGQLISNRSRGVNS